MNRMPSLVRFVAFQETLEEGVDDEKRGGLKGRYAIEAQIGPSVVQPAINIVIYLSIR